MNLKKILVVSFGGFILGALITYLLISLSLKKQANEVISHSILLQNIEDIGRLEVVRYNIKDIIEYKKVREWLPNAKTLLMVSGEIIVCIDLTKIGADDIQTYGDSISLTLPEPEICHTAIKHSNSKVYNLEFGLWESEEIMDQAYRYAERQLELEAQKLNIRDKSRENAANLLTPVLRSMGFKYITVTLKPHRQELGYLSDKF